MLSTIIKLLTWVKYKIYREFHSYYIKVSDFVKTQVLISTYTAHIIISAITTSDFRYISYAIYLLILRLVLNN